MRNISRSCVGYSRIRRCFCCSRRNGNSAAGKEASGRSICASGDPWITSGPTGAAENDGNYNDCFPRNVNRGINCVARLARPARTPLALCPLLVRLRLEHRPDAVIISPRYPSDSNSSARCETSSTATVFRTEHSWLNGFPGPKLNRDDFLCPLLARTKPDGASATTQPR